MLLCQERAVRQRDSAHVRRGSRALFWMRVWLEMRQKFRPKSPFFKLIIASNGCLNFIRSFEKRDAHEVRRTLLTIGLFTTICSGLYGQPTRAVEPLSAKMNANAATASTPVKVKVYVLLGGLVGMDGYATSAGMFQLAKMLRSLPNTSVTTFTWDKWREAYRVILANEGKAKIVVIGYSGGGSRATWLANTRPRPKIDLLISYDPSPKWQIKPIGANVKMALCYHNTRAMWLPGFGNFGGGRLINGVRGNADSQIEGPKIENFNVAEQHMLVQFDQSLHRQTIEAVRSLERSTPGRNSKLASLPRTITATHESKTPLKHLSLNQNTE